MKRGLLTGLVLMGLGAAAAAQAQTPAGAPPERNPIVSGVSQCRTITDATARLACYDAAATALDQAVAQNQLVVMDREQVRRTRRSLFGFALPNLRLFSDEDGMEQGEITGTIASARPLGHGKWQIRLDDGGTWETTEATRNDPARGDTVRIRRAALGSYWLNVRTGRAVRARRVG
jgi:hypothetical protein